MKKPIIIGLCIVFLFGLCCSASAWYSPLMYYKLDSYGSNGFEDIGDLNISLTGYYDEIHAAVINTGVYFNGSSKGEVHNYSTNIDISTAKTFDFWFNVSDDFASDQYLFNFQPSVADNNDQFGVQITSDQKLEVRWYASGLYRCDNANLKSNETLIPNVWYHAVILLGNATTNMSLYLNGQKNSSFVCNQEISTALDHFKLGDDVKGTSANFNGSVDNFYISAYRYSEADIASSYNSGNGLEFTGNNSWSAETVFPVNLIENATTIYTLQINKNSTSISSNATFYYDGVEYEMDKFENTTTDIYNVTINQATVTGFNTSVEINLTYYIIETNTSSTKNVIEETEVVSRMILGICNNTINVTAVNFSVKDSDTSSQISNYDFEASFDIWDTRNPTYKKNYGFDINSLSKSNKLCVYPPFANYGTDYDTLFTHANYEDKGYNALDSYLNSSTQQINIFMINSTSTTDITVTIVDENDIELVGYLVEVYRYNLGGDNYTLMDSEYSDSSGKVKYSLDVSTYEYKFEVKDSDGELLHEEPKQKLIDTEYTLRVYINAIPGIVYPDIYDLDITLNADRINKDFNLSWSDINSAASSINLTVIKSNGTSNISIVYTASSTSNSGSLSYHITETTTNVSVTYVANVYVVAVEDNSSHFLFSRSIDFKKEWDIFGEESLFATFMFVGTMIFVGAFVGAQAAILLTLFGMFGLWLLGFYMASLSGLIALALALIILFVRVKSR
jgi:hypothetical protein